MKRPPLLPQLRDESGAVAMIAALSMTMIMGAAALSIDMGTLHLGVRNLQAATDMAALSATSAASQGNNATTVAARAAAAAAAASTYIAKNLASTTQSLNVVSGSYCPDATLSAAARFTPGGGTCYNSELLSTNAVQVSTTINSPLYFAKTFQSAKTQTLRATATAAQINEAGFYAGTGVASLNAGLINAMLKGLLNANINLASYNGLATANVDALSFFKALSTNLGITAGTYSSLLQTSATVQQVLQAEIDALNATGSIANASAVSALGTIKASITGSPTVSLSRLFDLGIWQNMPVGSTATPAALSASMNAFQLATLTAQVANGKNFVSVPNFTTGIPGLATLSISASAIEPAQGPAFVFSPIGTTVHTAQVRLQVNFVIGSLLGGLVNLPIYVEVADGNAQLTGISCGTNFNTDAKVQIAATSGVAHVYVGNSTGSLTNFTKAVSVTPATLLNVLGVVTITGNATAAIASGTATNLTFYQPGSGSMPSATQGPIGSPLTVSSTGILSNTMANLESPLKTNLNINLLGLGLGLGSVTSALGLLLDPAFASLDSTVDGLLSALGIKVGYMDVTATGVRCGVPTLVY